MKFIIKGDLAYSKDKDTLITQKDAYMLIEDGKIKDISYSKQSDVCKFYDYTGHLIIPGLIDMHVHAPQYSFRGIWMDMELIDWLNHHTFPEESKYSSLDYANKAYSIFVDELKHSATTRACIFATLHLDSTLMLMDKLEESGLITYVGKVNMDRNAPDILIEKDASTSISDTISFIESSTKYKNTFPILTPRFIPSCSDELMEKIGNIVKERNIPLQSHLSENTGEIEWVKSLCPWSKNYADAYDHFDTFGSHTNTIMAHCVWCTDEEIELMKKRNIYIAHCPSSNANLSSGIAPVKRYLDEGINIGLGSDVAGGTDKSIIKCMALSVQMSKMYWRLVDHNIKAINIKEAFYMATLGPSTFFGKVGSFMKDYDADILVLDESKIPTTLDDLSIEERLERFIYLCDDRDILHKFVAGNKIL